MRCDAGSAARDCGFFQDGHLTARYGHGMIHCRREPALSVDDFARILDESGLGATRPLADRARLGEMLRNAALVMTARDDAGTLLGVARCLTDASWIAFLSELAVGKHAQGRGIGAQLLHAVRAELGPRVTLVLISMPDVTGFYARAGMETLADGFLYRRIA